MIALLSRLFIKRRAEYNEPKVRAAYGLLCSIIGIFFNILLFAEKYFAGVITGSIAMTADAFNNLSDAASSVITLIGFKLAEQEPHPNHPFGHGRFEYISGVIVSFLIILMGFEIGKSSLQKILHPEEAQITVLSLVILAASIAVKLYMFFYNRAYAKKIDSAAMRATATDSLSDAASTAGVLICSLISLFTDVHIDGWCGILIALFILYSGVRAAKDTIAPLLGQPPSAEFVNQIEEIVRMHPQVVGIHDLVVHDYGPGRRMISLHGEVPGSMNVFEMHDIIDHIEVELHSKLGCETVIHMDPIDTENELLSEIHQTVSEALASMDKGLSCHDLRMVPGPLHTNVIFDILVPSSCKLSDAKIFALVRQAVSGKYGENFCCVIKSDRSYI